MKKIVIGVLLFMFFSVETALCIEVGGVILPDTLKAGDSELLLNGTGIRRKFGFKVYSTGLYLKSKETDGKKIINADESMALIMHWRRSVPSEKIKSVFL